MPKRTVQSHGPNRVREWRKRRGLTLQTAAPMIGLSWTHLSRIEKGERELNETWLIKISEALKCEPCDLLRPELGGISQDERDIVEIFRRLSEKNKSIIVEKLNILLKSSQ